MRNMSMKKGLVKNTRIIIEQLHHRFIQICVMNNLTGAIGQPISIPHIHFQFTPAKSTWTIQHLQYPLRLAYATTFHGCIDKTIIDSRSKVFAHGQLYTSILCVHNQNDT